MSVDKEIARSTLSNGQFYRSIYTYNAEGLEEISSK